MNNLHKLYHLLMFLLPILLMSGCTGGISSFMTATPPNASIHPTEVPALTPPLFSSPTPMHVGTSTASFSPTANPSYVTNYLIELYGKEDCQPPCWWGITPGKTSWEDVYTQFSPLGNVRGPSQWNDLEYYSFEFRTINGGLPVDDVGFTLWVQDEKVLSILSYTALVTNRRSISLADVLKLYGLPDEIWLANIRWGNIRPDTYINLYYPSKGIWVFWQNLVEVHDDNKLTICPTNRVPEYNNMMIFLFPPSSHLQFEGAWEIVNGNFDERLGKQGPYGLLEEFTDNFDSEDFYEIYLTDQSTECFDIDPTK